MMANDFWQQVSAGHHVEAASLSSTVSVSRQESTTVLATLWQRSSLGAGTIQVHADLGAGADALPTTLSRIIDAFSETSLLREAVFRQMLGRPTSAKGHARRLTDGAQAIALAA